VLTPSFPHTFTSTLGPSLPYGNLPNNFEYNLAEWKKRCKVPLGAKVFSINGGYEDLRRSLKRRGAYALWQNNVVFCW